MRPGVRDLVWERAQGRSDLTGRPLDRDRWECHHRRPGGMGGLVADDQDSPANLLALAPREHNLDPASVHLAPRWAKARGLLIPRGRGRLSVPHLVPVWWRGRGWVWLTADGGMVEVARPAGGSGTGDLGDSEETASGARVGAADQSG